METATLGRDAVVDQNGSPLSSPPVGPALSEAVRAVAATIAEELSQPVTSLVLKLELMLAEAGDDPAGFPARVGDLDVLQRNARRVVHLIEALRCYSGDGLQAIQPVRLNDLVARAYASAGASGEATLASEDPLILGDGAVLEQFVGRVMADACRTSGDERGVRVETMAAAGDPDHVVLVISGVGGVADLAESTGKLLAEHPGTVDAQVVDDRLVLTLPRLTLRLPGLTRAEALPDEVPHRRSGDRAGLERVVRALVDVFDVSEQAQRITESALALFHASSAITWLKQPDGSLSCVAAASERPARVPISDVLPRRVGLAGRAVAERRALWEVDLVAGHRTVLAVPLSSKGDVFGAIVTEHAAPWGVAQATSTIDRLQAFAGFIAPAMRDVQMLESSKAALAQAEAASRSKDEFLVLLAHEFRNSLLPIMTSAAIIRRTAGPDGPVQSSANIVKRQAQHMGRLIDDLRDLTRIAQGGIELRREPVSLAKVVSDTVEGTRPLTDLAGLWLVVSLPAVPLWVEGETTRLRQIVENLLSNAVKYTPPGGRIDVTVGAEGGEAVLRVRDTGIGILPEMLPHVFDLFFRSDHARAHTGDGMGVGLTLVRQLVTLHGGRVAVESDGPGRGAEFVVRLPLAAEAGVRRPTTGAA